MKRAILLLMIHGISSLEIYSLTSPMFSFLSAKIYEKDKMPVIQRHLLAEKRGKNKKASSEVELQKDNGTSKDDSVDKSTADEKDDTQTTGRKGGKLKAPGKGGDDNKVAGKEGLIRIRIKIRIRIRIKKTDSPALAPAPAPSLPIVAITFPPSVNTNASHTGTVLTTINTNSGTMSSNLVNSGSTKDHISGE